MRRRIVYGSVFILIIAGVGTYLLLQKEEKPTIRVDARKLYSDYKQDESTADQRYLGNQILLKGVVHEVLRESPYSVLVDGGDGYIQVEFKDHTKDLASGDTIVVLAKCTGFLMDVNLTNAKLITQ